MKPIHFHLFNPAERQLFFKPTANDRAKAYIISCSNSENCPLHKQGQCLWKPTFGYSKCPYGKYEERKGPTKRAKKLYEWCRQQKEEFKGVPYLSEPVAKLVVIGEYVYLPYAHIAMNKNIPILEYSHIFASGSQLMKREDFTIENIAKILNFVPEALFGGYIQSYQKEEMPKFIAHLSEVMPELYNELIRVYPNFIERYKLNNKNYVGRIALLKTINPCSFTTKGTREAKYQVKWQWDGSKLRTNMKDGEHAYNTTWGEMKDLEGFEIVLEPSDKTQITISDNSQVGPKTVFVN